MRDLWAPFIGALGAWMVYRAFVWARHVAAWPRWTLQQAYWRLACALAYIEASAGLGFVFFVVQMSR